MFLAPDPEVHPTCAALFPHACTPVVLYTSAALQLWGFQSRNMSSFKITKAENNPDTVPLTQYHTENNPDMVL